MKHPPLMAKWEWGFKVEEKKKKKMEQRVMWWRLYKHKNGTLWMHKMKWLISKRGAGLGAKEALPFEHRTGDG